MKIFIQCDEANHVCDKNQYKEASLLEKFKLSIHLIYCDACRKYVKTNSKLTKLFKKESIKVKLDSHSKEDLRSAFEKELQKQKQ